MFELAIIASVLAGPSTGDIWFTPRPGNEQWWCQGTYVDAESAHASAYQFTLPPDQASHVTTYDNCGPFDWWLPGIAWVIIDYCNDQGTASGGFQGGASPSTYSGPMGLLTLDEPTDIAPEAHCTHPDDPAAFWFDGHIPAIIMPGDWWITCEGDYTGDGVVNNLDLMWVLAYWDKEAFPDGFRILDYLSVIANWNTICTGLAFGPPIDPQAQYLKEQDDAIRLYQEMVDALVGDLAELDRMLAE